MLLRVAMEALATYHQVADDEPTRLYGVAMSEHTLGHAKESQQAVDELIAKHAQDSAYPIAEVYCVARREGQSFRMAGASFPTASVAQMNLPE
ncbi:MAG: hypothetical protein ACREQD_13265 [Candidatus Binataceae bacterium]